MQIIKLIIMTLIILVFTACSQRQIRAMYDDKSIYMITPSVDEFDKVSNPDTRPSYDEYHKQYR